MGMDTLVRDDKPQTWIKAGSSIRTDRAIQSISGIFDSPGAAVAPASLYLEQLRERLGDQALTNIGYPAATGRVP